MQVNHRDSILKLGRIWLLLFAMILLLSGCQMNKPSAEPLKLGVVLSDLDNPFFKTLETGILDAAKEESIEVIVMNSANDSNQEYEAVQNLLNQGVTLLVINPVDSDRVFKSVQSANERKIPVITVDRKATGGRILSSIVSDNEMGGRLAAEFMMDLCGNTGEYGEMRGLEGTSATQARGKGFNEEMVKSSQMTLAAVVTSDFNREKGRVEMKRLLSVHPDLVALFAHNDEMALGALEVAESLNIPVKIIGFDGTEEALKAIQEGRLQGTIAQQPYELGTACIETAQQYWKGESVKSEVKIDVVLVKKKN